jgi:hypothetical protein
MLSKLTESVDIDEDCRLILLTLYILYILFSVGKYKHSLTPGVFTSFHLFLYCIGQRSFRNGDPLGYFHDHPI